MSKTSVPVPRGQKTIKFTVAFHTTDLVDKKDAWDTGSVYIRASKARGISSPHTVAFNGLDDINRAIKQLCQDHKITIKEKH